LQTTQNKQDLKQGTLDIISAYLAARKSEDRIRTYVQKLFLDMFSSALRDLGGKNWNSAESDNKAQWLLAAKRLVKRELKTDDPLFDEDTFKKYFSIVSKCLLYEIDDWKFAEFTTTKVLDRAYRTISEHDNGDDTYYSQGLNYVEALKKQVRLIKEDDENQKTDDMEIRYKTDVNDLRVPTVNNKTEGQWRNAALNHIITFLTHPSTEIMLEGMDNKAQALRQILDIAEKNATQVTKKSAA